MGCKLNLAAYERLIEEDIAWLRQQPHGLESYHIEQVLEWSITALYPPRPCDGPSSADEHIERGDAAGGSEIDRLTGAKP